MKPFGDVEGCVLRPGNVHSADGWRALLEPVSARSGVLRSTFISGVTPPSRAFPLLSTSQVTERAILAAAGSGEISTAIDVQTVPSDEPGRVGRQKNGGAGDVFRGC